MLLIPPTVFFAISRFELEMATVPAPLFLDTNIENFFAPQKEGKRSKRCPEYSSNAYYPLFETVTCLFNYYFY
jgi:hypothetical protein